tara:strand:+ start:2861 stop:3028 length:168 start_codon:yes stop_codon:yes gene_type:complete
MSVVVLDKKEYESFKLNTKAISDITKTLKHSAKNSSTRKSSIKTKNQRPYYVANF